VFFFRNLHAIARKLSDIPRLMTRLGKKWEGFAGEGGNGNIMGLTSTRAQMRGGVLGQGANHGLKIELVCLKEGTKVRVEVQYSSSFSNGEFGRVTERKGGVSALAKCTRHQDRQEGGKSNGKLGGNL